MSVFSAPLSRAMLLGATFVPGAAIADLAANDVWQHFKDVSALYGGALEGTTSQKGETLTITDMRFAADLPFDAGKLAVDLGDIQLREASDGSVSLIYPSNIVLQMRYMSADGETYGGGMTVTHEGLVSKATGRRDEITFDYAASRIDMSLDIPTLPEGLESYSGSGFLSDVTGRSVHQMASGLDADASLSVGKHSFTADQSMRLEDEDGAVQVKNTSGGNSMTAQGKTSIPAGGIDLVDLAASLRSGLAVSGLAKISDYSTNQVTAQDGAVIARQHVTAESYETSMTLNASGASIEGPSEGLRIEVEMPTMGGMIFGADIASGYGKFRAPLLKDETFDAAQIKLDLNGIVLDESLWAMGDPTGILPRDPANLNLDLTGKIRHQVEWLDFANVEAATDTLTGLPVEPESLQLNTLRLSAAGAEITGEGAFTFDLTDLQSFDGMPRPEGKLTLRAKGLNALLQKLQQLGMPDDQIGSGMMMLGMFTAPDPENGEDARKTVLEVTPEGQVLNNGMRIR
ncbi:MAG: DUF2125 domain-containing protein [Rhodobacteraceae bacterium]|nr:DUF2125 domain-containing protein [Paracoccaceae bacterium]